MSSTVEEMKIGGYDVPLTDRLIWARMHQDVYHAPFVERASGGTTRIICEDCRFTCGGTVAHAILLWNKHFGIV